MERESRRINKSKALELLKQLTQKIQYLRALHYDNPEVKPWRSRVESLLRSAFDAEDYEKFANVDLRSDMRIMGDEVHQRNYKYNLTSRETALQAIIDKHEILETKEAPANNKGEDTIKSLIHLFDALKLHPQVVEASRSCFESELYREAILNAFIVFIDYVKEITGLDLDGDDLINKVFSFEYDKNLRKITKYPIIRINDLKGTNDRSEQQGFMYLCKGAAGYNRNPKAHKLIPQSNPYHTLEQLAFASLLIRRVEEGKIVKPTAKRDKWDWDKFLSNIQGRCDSEITNLAKNLYNFTRSNADSISWGTGTKDGSFTFRKLGVGKLISIFSVYSYGGIYINFSSMKNKNVNDNTIESFKDSLNRIPNIILTKEAVISGYPRIFEKPLTNPENLKLFQDAVIALCQQLDAKGAA